MAFIVPGTCRYTVNGNAGDRPWACITDVSIFSIDITSSREEAVADMAEIVLNAWCDTILTQQSTSSQFTSVSWVDLDNPDGTVGSITAGRDEVLPQVGAIAGEPFPASNAALATKVVPRRRGQRLGRMYIPGLGESQASGGVLTAPAQTALNTAVNDYRTLINQDELAGPPYSANFVVVHITARDADGNPTEGVSDDITSLSVQSRMATQRRRLRK